MSANRLDSDLPSGVYMKALRVLNGLKGRRPLHLDEWVDTCHPNRQVCHVVEEALRGAGIRSADDLGLLNEAKALVSRWSPE